MSRPIWLQHEVNLSPKRHGVHLVTSELTKEIDISSVEVGLAHFFIQHTSASLSLNENADPTVRSDLTMALEHIAPRSLPYEHTCEGPDDMPAHVKASLMGSSVTVPIRSGRWKLGTWQGIYLCEHRDSAGSRRVVITVSGSGN